MGEIYTLEEHKKIRQYREDLKYWREHLRLAYKNDWDNRCTKIAKREIKRLLDILDPDRLRIGE